MKTNRKYEYRVVDEHTDPMRYHYYKNWEKAWIKYLILTKTHGFYAGRFGWRYITRFKSPDDWLEPADILFEGVGGLLHNITLFHFRRLGVLEKAEKYLKMPMNKLEQK